MITINGTDYDTYVTVEQVDEYANGSLNAAAWGALVNDDKARAVVMATRWIDSQNWTGDKVDPDQSLKWPRVIDGAVIITPIEQAATLLVVLIAANPELADQMTGNVGSSANGGVKMLKAGSVATEYFRNLSSGSGTPFPVTVMSLTGDYLLKVAGTGVDVSLAFGTFAPSTVGVRDRYGFTDPV
jgi:hypothetical protein